MNEAGIYTTDGCLRYIVDNFDNDENGKISAEEFGNCTAGIHPKSLESGWNGACLWLPPYQLES